MIGRTVLSGRRIVKPSAMRSDRSGQVSFAVIAVVLLTASAVTGTYLAKQQLDQVKADRRDRLLEAMEGAIGGVVQELELCGASRAQEVLSSWQAFPVNETAISEAFSNEIACYISSSFPRTDGKFTLGVSNWTGGLFFIEKKTIDLVSSDSVKPGTVQIDGIQMAYSKLPPPSVEMLSERSVNPYYVALGNFSVKVANNDVQIVKQTSFQRPIISALPFLESKLRAFESASDGELSDLGRLVGYMLSTLCELRVLEGYGKPTYTGLNTSDILSEQDVYKAVSVGLLLEQARLFKSVDAGFASGVENLCGGNGLGIAAVMGSSGRNLDPAELFLWFLGKSQPMLDPRMIVAEAVFGIADQLALKFMDYLGWLGALDSAKGVLDDFRSTLESVAAFFTGEDKAKTAVVTWISKVLSAAGANVTTYSELFTSQSDFTLPIGEKQYYVEDAAGDLYPVWVGNITAPVDVPQYDILSSDSWTEFYPAFKGCQTNFRTLVTDSVSRLAFDLAGVAELELPDLVVDPTDDSDLFDSLSLGAGTVKLSIDPVAISKIGKNLPFFSSQYELSHQLGEFLSSKGTQIVDIAGMKESVYADVAISVLASARYSYIPNLGVPVEQQLAAIVRNDVEFDTSWGLGSSISYVLESLSKKHLERIAILVDQSVVTSEGGFCGPVVDSVASMICSGAEGMPGIAEMLEKVLTAFSKEVLRQKEVGGYKRSVYLDIDQPFEFWDGERSSALENGRILNETLAVSVEGGMPSLRVVPFDPVLGYTSLEKLFPTDDLSVQIKRPWDFDRGKDEYPNVHMTSISNISACPYSTQWTVSVLGLLNLRLSSSNLAFQSILGKPATESRTSARIELSLPIVVHSAWPLQGVEYNPSNTALKDGLAVAQKFLDKVWDKLEPVFGWVKDGLERIYRFVTHAFEVLASFATKVIKVISSALQTMVETLQEYIQKIADSALAKAVKFMIDLYGRVEFRVSWHGFTIIVQTDIPDLIYKHGSDLLRVMVCTDRLGPGITFGIRIARLSDGSYDILANGTISLRNTVVEVMVDPLMHILRRFVEVHCTGKTWAMDVVMPEVEPYELVGVSTADIPGVGAFLSNIPIPVLGLSASIEAGIQLKYSPPFPTDVVVNEFESNPLGEDSGREWVELYNPLAEPRCIDGWMITTVHGKNSAMRVDGTIPGNGLMVFTFPETSIDNGEPGNPFNDGDAVALLDPAGATVDITPMLRDNGNDERTNQRSWDGGPRWVFKEGSRGNSNGVPVLLATSDFIAKALFEAFKEAFIETQLQEVSASLDFVTLFAKRVLNNFIENMLALVSEIIHDVIFFIEVVLSDASGAAGIGFRASFIVTGEAIVDLLRWLIHSFATFVVNLGRASTPIAYPPFPRSFFSGMFLSFEVLFTVGMPKMVRLLGAAGDLQQRFTLALSISPNIPALGKLVGRDWGNWSIEFGACVEGVPRDFVNGMLTTNSGKLIDFWLLKGVVHGL